MRIPRTLKWTAILALLVALPLLALAGPRGQGRGPGHGPGHGPGFGMDRGPGFDVERMAAHLDLDEAQQAEIEQILEAHRPTAEAQRAAMGEAREAMRALRDAETFDEAAVRAAATALADAKVEMMVSRALLKHQVDQVLTPEQRERAAEMRERRQARMEERRDRFQGRRGPRGSGADDLDRF